MKAFLRFFYIVLVAIVVFTGALYIAEGMRSREAEQTDSRAEDAQRDAAILLPDFLDSGEGSAL